MKASTSGLWLAGASETGVETLKEGRGKRVLKPEAAIKERG